jgi:muramoyltetrapeptide carboxypeptidase
MIIPPVLVPGDAVGIVSTARKITTSELSYFLDALTSWGLVPVLGASINAESHQFAGDDLLRSQDFQQMLDRPDIKAIWCARGGYGTIRMLDDLDFSTFIGRPKWIIGYSDVTVLHSKLHLLGVESLHANMALELDFKTQETSQSIREVLFGEDHSIQISSSEKNRVGATKAALVGGNLSLLYSMLGSPTAINTDGKILFIEDLDEYLYHIDRMMMNLKRNGLLTNLRGLIVGGMNDMNDNTIPFGKNAEEIIWDAVKEYDYPVCFNFPAGHINDNRALILGRSATFAVYSDTVQLSF